MDKNSQTHLIANTIVTMVSIVTTIIALSIVWNKIALILNAIITALP